MRRGAVRRDLDPACRTRHRTALDVGMAVGAQRQLITTNRDIVNYDLYDPGAVCVVDREDPRLPVDFLSERRAPFNDNLRETYSLSTWVNQIFKPDMDQVAS